jgi:hypothetical protein
VPSCLLLPCQLIPSSPAHASLIVPTTHIGREGSVNLRRVRKAEVGHDVHELLLGLGQAGVVHLLLKHGGDCAALVVVCGVDQAVVGQRENLGVHVLIEQTRVSTLQSHFT